MTTWKIPCTEEAGGLHVCGIAKESAMTQGRNKNKWLNQEAVIPMESLNSIYSLCSATLLWEVRGKQLAVRTSF